MKRLFTLAALVGVVLPATVAAQPNAQDAAARACKAQRNAIGMEAFRLLYAPAGKPKAAMDACLDKQAALVATEEKNAAKACKAERAADKAAFETKYATFGKCVSSKAKESVAEAQQSTVNAAKKCKAERAANPAAFETNHGTNANKKNAFGKCVSKLANSD
jgi:hypothetical protein